MSKPDKITVEELVRESLRRPSGGTFRDSARHRKPGSATQGVTATTPVDYRPRHRAHRRDMARP